jgi:hypothetical protein
LPSVPRAAARWPPSKPEGNVKGLAERDDDKGETSMMSCWKIVGLGLVVGGLAAACTVTSDDDDTGAGGSSTTYTGGTAGATGTAGAGGAATAGASSVGGTAGTSATAATDQACFNCLAPACTEYDTCGSACEVQLSAFRECAYQRQYGLQADQNGVPELYGRDQQDTCLNVIDNGEINNLDPAVGPVIGCADDAGLSCQTTCFVFTN